MVIADADDGAEMRHARPKGGGRKPPEQGLGASNTTARSQPSPPEVEVRLMDEIVSRANMMAAYHRVMANKGAAGIDRMTVEQLQPYLREHWPRIKEELLDGRYRPQPVRGVEIPKPGGGMRQLGIPTGGRPADPAGDASGPDAAVRSRLLRGLVRLPSGASRARCGACRAGARGRGPALRRRPRSGEVLGCCIILHLQFF